MNIPKDKLAHAAMGAATVLATLGILVVAARFGRPQAAILAAVLIGVGYEGVQLLRKETAELADAIATIAGGVLTVGVLLATGLI